MASLQQIAPARAAPTINPAWVGVPHPFSPHIPWRTSWDVCEIVIRRRDLRPRPQYPEAWHRLTQIIVPQYEALQERLELVCSAFLTRLARMTESSPYAVPMLEQEAERTTQRFNQLHEMLFLRACGEIAKLTPFMFSVESDALLLQQGTDALAVPAALFSTSTSTFTSPFTSTSISTSASAPAPKSTNPTVAVIPAPTLAFPTTTAAAEATTSAPACEEVPVPTSGHVSPVQQTAHPNPVVLRETLPPVACLGIVGCEAARVLDGWFMTHLDNPYPSLEEQDTLANICNCSAAQVITWFNNRRSRFKRQILNEEATAMQPI